MKPVIFKTQIILAIVARPVVFFANPNQEERPSSFPPKVVETQGNPVPKDSMAAPKVIPAGKPKLYMQESRK